MKYLNNEKMLIMDEGAGAGVGKGSVFIESKVINVGF